MNNIICVNAQRREVPTYLSLSAISIYFIKPLYSKKASSPTKTAEILAIGIPIITNAGIGDSDDILTKNNSGVLINSFNEKEYLHAAKQIPLLLQTEKKHLRQTAENYFSLAHGVEMYKQIYDKLLNE